jgi:polar amino acid transport system substrate-binding protein
MLKEIWSTLEAVIDRIHREEGGFSVRGFGYEDLKREIPDMLNDLYMGAQDIKKIVEGLKDYARAASAPVIPSLVDANECLRYAARLLKHSIAVATDHFEVVLAEKLPHVHADRLKLTQVVVNVLENAIQALPDRHHGVRMSTSIDVDADGREVVVIRVADDGIGMSPETLSLVFEPFFTTKRDRGGSGLGLAVASGIVRDLGGTIQLRSSLGEGTLAMIQIPAAGRSEESDDGR